ncbi:MAG: LysE family transporter [Salinivirgaceae bacterium]|nr:LysE family transporter [Salinivirgaceae bacterium]MDD4748171.1 LysE family transporter [Salinivirgaceae bacterium]MDY0281686.1 LysE family transporter [Salinivirgaceae bacterium]
MIAETVNVFVVLVKGIVIGFAVSAPMGPIGVLCVQKTINKGRRIGFLSGLGAATADSVYAIIAAFGLGYTQRLFTEHQLVLQVGGVIVLLFLGFRIFFTNPVSQIRKQATRKYPGIFEDFVSVFFLTLSNPLTIIFFGASIAALGIFDADHTLIPQLAIVAGVFLGAALWWFIITGVVNLFRHKFRLKQLWWMNKLSGGIIILLTILAAIGLYSGLVGNL